MMQNSRGKVLRKLAIRLQDIGTLLWVRTLALWRRHRGDLLTAILLVLAVGVDLWRDRISQAENCMPPEERGPISTPLREFVPTPRLPHVRYVAIVSLRPGSEPKEIFNDECQLKLYLARLITRLAEDDPAVIVVDNYIPGEACGTPDNVTNSLRLAIENSNIPIVLGQKTEFLDYSERATGEESTCLVLSRNWAFDAPRVTKGLMKVNRNFKRIPLKWSVFVERNDVLDGRPTQEHGIAAVATDVFTGGSLGIVNSRAYVRTNRGLEPSYAKLLAKGEHPYVGGGLLPPGEFHISSASDILGGSMRDTGSILRGRIVIIGDFSASNSYQVGPDQKMAGPVLQANYIEALLDYRAYFPFSYGGFSLFYIIWLLIMQRAFWKSKSPERTGLAFLLLFIVFNLIVMQFHVFLGVLKEGASLGAVVVKWVEARGHSSAHH